MAFFPIDDPEGSDRVRSLMGPGQVDQQIRQAIHFAWMMLPDDKKNVAEVERVIRQMVDPRHLRIIERTQRRSIRAMSE